MSVYGPDNRSMIDALRRLNGTGRGVVCIDPERVSDEELDNMHAVGVRGVRLNLRTRSQKLEKDEFVPMLRSHADRMRRLRRVLQLYISLDKVADIASEIPSLGIPVVIDHIGQPSTDRPPREQNGYAEFMALLREGKVWVKLSGTYRFVGLPELDSYVREIIRVAPSQIVWASDWPHSAGVENNPGGDRDMLQDYRKIHAPAFIRKCREWCNFDKGLVQKIWVDNPRPPWNYDDDE